MEKNTHDARVFLAFFKAALERDPGEDEEVLQPVALFGVRMKEDGLEKENKLLTTRTRLKPPYF
jgi:hypothetical protein